MAPWRSVVTAIGIIGSLPQAAVSQTVVTPGARVRLEVVNGPRLTGALVRVLDDSLELALESSRKRIRLAPEEVRHLQVSRGLRSAAGTGALIGAALGVTAGLMVGVSMPNGEVSRNYLLAASGAGFGVIGGALGLFVGSFTTKERWEPGMLPPIGTPLGGR